jgi:MFS transporter, DHA1 family, multidrug resistance protein
MAVDPDPPIDTAARPPGPARRRGRERLPPVLVLVGGVVLATSMVSFLRVPLLPDVRRDLGLTTTELGTITAAFALGRLLMDLPAGRIVDRLPASATLVGSGAGLAIGSAVLAIAGSLAPALAGVAVVGAASALTNTAGMTVFATSAPPERRGAAMAGFQTALMTGQTLGPAAGGGLSAVAGWRATFAVGGGLGVAVAAICAAARVGTRSRRGRSAAAAARDERVVPGMSRVEGAALASVPFAVFFGFGALTQTLVPLIGHDDLALSTAAVGLVIGGGGLMRFAGAWITGVTADRVSRKAALVPSLVTMAAGAALLALPPTRAGWVAAIVLLALGSSGVSLAATVIADKVPAASLGRRLGTYRFTGDAGMLAGPAIAGALYAGAGRPAAMLATGALLAACAAGVGTLVHEAGER